MTPTALATLFKDSPLAVVAALCVLAMVGLFAWLMRIQGLRLEDRDKHIAELQSAHDAETAALRLTIPLSEKLAIAVSIIEARNRRRASSEPPK